MEEYEDPDKYYAEEMAEEEGEDGQKKGKGRGRGRGRGKGKGKGRGKGKGKKKGKGKGEGEASRKDAADQPVPVSQELEERKPAAEASEIRDEAMNENEDKKDKTDEPAASASPKKKPAKKATASPKVKGTRSRARKVLQRAKSMTPKKVAPSKEDSTIAEEVLLASLYFLSIL